MTLIVPNVGEVAMLRSFLGVAGELGVPYSLRLFSNNVTPGSASVAGDFTLVTGGGYAHKSLAAASWDVTSDAPSKIQYNAVQAFVFTGATDAPGTIYGYLIVDSAGILIAAERLPFPPYTPSVNGDTINITPVITLGSVNSD